MAREDVRSDSVGSADLDVQISAANKDVSSYEVRCCILISVCGTYRRMRPPPVHNAIWNSVLIKSHVPLLVGT
jgi:hypothetical protein